MSNDTTAAPLALLRGDRLVSVIATHDDGRARVYHLAAQVYTYEPVADLTYPTATPTVKLTEAQRIVCCYRFQDVATDTDDMGAVLEGNTLRITRPLVALETLDEAIDICDDNASGGDAKYRREAGTTRRLRAKVLAAIRAAEAAAQA